MEKAASSTKRLKRFPLFVDLLRVLNVFEKLKARFLQAKIYTVLTNLHSNFMNAILLLWVFVFGQIDISVVSCSDVGHFFRRC